MTVQLHQQSVFSVLTATVTFINKLQFIIMPPLVREAVANKL